MPNRTNVNDLEPVPRKVRVVRWGLICSLALISAFLMPHTLAGAWICYCAIDSTLFAITGIGLPPTSDAGDRSSPLVMWFVALLWNSGMLTFWVLIFGPIWSEYRLLVWGTAGLGSVVNRRTSVSGPIAHGTRYEIDFDHPLGRSSMVVDENFFNEVSIGDSFAVAYNPLRPTKSILVDGCRVFGLR